MAAGADPNALTDKAKTPLHVAVNTGRSDMIPILIEAGCDLNAQTL